MAETIQLHFNRAWLKSIVRLNQWLTETKIIVAFPPRFSDNNSLPPAVRMLYWLAAPIFTKTKKQQTSSEGGRILRSGKGRLRETFQEHFYSTAKPLPTDPPSPDSTDPKISAFSNVISTSSRSSTVRTLDCRTSRAPRRNSTKDSALFF